MKLAARLWIAVGVLILLSPLGLILPARFRAGGAWGEWGAGEMREMAGYVPRGLAKLGDLWKAPMPDYAFKGWAGSGMARASAAYILCAILGVAVIALAAWLIGKILARKE